ncbi:MAG: putative ATP-dependent carboligase [Planctomycetota bacterium]|nr:putative ATP-dependent carboligase [Planctomycetota bacterium]
MPLLILGASARAAAQSAVRAGLAPITIDLFADRDLAAIATTHRIDPGSYPNGLEEIVARIPGDDPWIYTGALENAPDLIDRVAALRPLWGISGASLRAVRDPLAVAEALASRGLPAPRSRVSDDGLPRDGSWLVKPLASAGGRGIRPLLGENFRSGRSVYFQSRIEGTSLAALFVGSDGGSTLLGVTRQLLGREGEPFAYLGSLGPWPLPRPVRESIAAIGQALVEAFRLRGVFGVDLILDAQGRPLPVEVNPRYTASTEVLELASGRPLLLEHRRAFDSGVSGPTRSRIRPPAFVGKAVVYADRRCILPAIDAHRLRPDAARSFAVPPICDLPAEGTVFEPGDPVLTVLSRGTTLESCSRRLHCRLARWRTRLSDADG